MISIPKHVGIIMDGNGRWAAGKGLPRTAGHKEGITTAKKIIKEAIKLGVKNVTLYVFSTENWARTQKEVGFLMKLIIFHMRTEASFYMDNNIRVRHAGDMEGLPKDVQAEIKNSIQKTKDNKAITVTLAINYGGRDEIIRSVNRWLESKPKVRFLNEKDLSEHLDNSDISDPDLIIRTAGEKRLSNFLLWESAYSEYFFSDKLWPDFTAEDLKESLESYAKRDRKFGGIK